MESYNERTVDPLLFLNTDKNDLDAFLMSTSGDMAHLNDDLHGHDVKMDSSLDIDSLEQGGHLGDMTWLHNSSLSTLTHLDPHNDDTSDGSNLISVDPQSVLPMQIASDSVEPEVQQDVKPTRHFHSPDFANSAAMRLHANCSSLGDSPETLGNTPSKASNSNIIRQDHETIRILSVASKGSPVNSPIKQKPAQNYVITSSPRNSPLKPQTFVLSSGSGLPTGFTLSAATPVSRVGNHLVISSPQKLHTIATDRNGRVLLKSGNNLLSPSQASPVLLGRLQTGIPQSQLHHHHVTSHGDLLAAASQGSVAGLHLRQQHAQLMAQHTQASADSSVSSTTGSEEKVYPKPVFSYSCLIALALKNSKNGSLPVSEIYSFMCENFPYFKTAPDGWKNSVRHNLSLNKCFAKVDNPKLNQGAKKGCLWALNPAKVAKMEDEISKWGKKDPAGLLCSMAYPENLEAIEKGQAGLHYNKDNQSTEPKRQIPQEMEVTATRVPSHSDISSPVRPVQLIKQEPAAHSQQSFIRIDKFHPNIRVEKMEPRTPTRTDHYPQGSDMVSSPVQKQAVSTATSPSKTLNLSFSKLDPTIDLSQLELPANFNHEALADIVLQSALWDEDLENNIDIDLFCDSPTSSQHGFQSTNSPLTVRSPANQQLLHQHEQQLLQHFATTNNPSSSAPSSFSPSVHPLYSQHVSSSPVQTANPSATNVRANLFGGVSSPLKPLYAS